MDQATLQAWWWQRQGLDGGLDGAGAEQVVTRTGWARSVGGVGPYLALFARGGVGREAADSAVAQCAIHELPAARGCTYVVPACDFALALRVGQAFAGADMKTARQLGVTGAEVDKLERAVLDALGKTALDPDQIRDAVGGAARSLGEAGKKKGLNSTLPLALGRLQAAGEIRRVPVNGRLDQQRYRYARWRPNPLAACKLTEAEASTELSRRYFDWTAPATLSEFQWFSGLGVKAAKAAVEPLGIEPLAAGDQRLIPPALRKAFTSFKRPAKPHYALVSSIDSLFLLRRNLPTVIAAADLNRLERLPNRGAGGGLMDLPSHAIVDRGRVVGIWEYDPATESLVWAAFVKPDAALRAAVARTEEYVRSDLGDARSFSLDSPKSRAPRIAAIRAMAG